MFDANMRHLPKGHKFIVDVWGCKESSPLYSLYKGSGKTLLLCTMLDEESTNPRVEVHIPCGESLVVNSHSVEEGIFQHHVIYLGTVWKDGTLVDFQYQQDYDRAEQFMKEFGYANQEK